MRSYVSGSKVDIAVYGVKAINWSIVPEFQDIQKHTKLVCMES